MPSNVDGNPEVVHVPKELLLRWHEMLSKRVRVEFSHNAEDMKHECIHRLESRCDDVAGEISKALNDES